MKKLAELKRARATMAKRLQDLALKEADLPEGEELPSEELTEIEKLKLDIAEMDGRIGRLEEALSVMADAAEPLEGGDAEPGDTVDTSAETEEERRVRAMNGKGARLTPHGYGEPQRKNAPGNFVARMMIARAWVKSGMSYKDAAAEIERRFSDKAVAKALNTAGVGTGGALIPQHYVQEIIDLLRAQAVVRKLNPEFRDMPFGNMTIPRLVSPATASYGGELDAIQVSQQSFDALQLNAKKLTAVVPVSNDLIRRTPMNVEGIITGDLVRTTALREDLAFLLADGSQGTPVGLYNQALAANKITIPAFTGTDNATILSAVVGAVNAMKLTMRQGMSGMVRPAWIMSPVTEAFLRGLRDQVGSFVYKDELDAGRFEGLPFEVTQQIPTNINTGTTEAPVNNGAYLMLVDFADVIVADTMNYQMDISDQATYVTGGQTVSAFQMDQTVFRVIQEHDIGVKHQASIVVAMLPGWAPAGYTNFSGGNAYYAQAPSNSMSAAPSTWGVAAPTGSNNPANIAANVPGGTQPGRV